MTTRAEILKMLSDGAFHSGTDLGNKLGITRAAVCKNIRRLTQSGLDVHRVTGRGYKLDAPLTPLNRSRILKHLGSAGAGFRARPCFSSTKRIRLIAISPNSSRTPRP